MSARAATSIPTFVAVAAFLLAAGVLRAREVSDDGERGADKMLYVRSGALASRLYLSFDAVGSDLYWIRAIQHYGQERRSPRAEMPFGLLEPLVDLTTTLDPKFNIAYRFGAILIALDPPDGPGRPDRAIAILEKGLRANPDRWHYAHDIGFVHYWHTGRFDEAARWFERAASMPGAPRWLGPLAAVTRARGGDRQGARQLLIELAATSDGYIKRSAERGLAQLQALDELDRLQTLIHEHRARTGAFPATLVSLRAPASSGAFADPTGRSYTYDAERGVVSLAPDSPLSPLPRPFERR
jgi:tetratricopeptide (TPR) repeat protein